MWRADLFLMTIIFRFLGALFKERQELVFENLTLRQQVTALKQKRPKSRLRCHLRLDKDVSEGRAAGLQSEESNEL